MKHKGVMDIKMKKTEAEQRRQENKQGKKDYQRSQCALEGAAHSQHVFLLNMFEGN